MKRLTAFLASALFSVGLLGITAPSAFAAESHRTISVNGQQLASVPGIVQDNTTYMPIWYIMRALTSLGIANHWDGHNWSISVGDGTPLGANDGGSAPDAIMVNGQALYRVKGVVQNGTTYMPIWYIIQMLNKIGVHNTWDGKAWDITGTVQSTSSGTTGTSANSLGNTTNSNGNTTNVNTTTQPTSVTLPNAATDDSLFWSRANNDIYIEASTFLYDGNNSGQPILSAEPGTPIYLTAASSHMNVSANPQWFVNSQDATITTNTNVTYTIGNYQAGVGTFTATKPGIYTVQAESNGVYSEPLVILVGLDKLTAAKSLAVDSKTTGVQALPSGLTGVVGGTVNGVTYTKYQPINGWLPVSGTVTGTSSVEVYFQSETSPNSTWVYRLPVVNGHFSGMVRMPFTGQLVVTFFPHFNQMLTSSQGTFSFSDSYVVSNSVPIARQDAALLASAEMDVNMSPAFANEASILMTNSPTRRTGIVAINNFAAGYIEYDMQSYLSNTSIWHDSYSEWTLRLGECGDIAELAATMMKSIGVPVETLVGNAGGGSHEWLQAYNGSSWEVLDPTWDAPTHSQSTEPVDILSNEYNDNSPDFLSSHHQTGLGGWQ